MRNAALGLILGSGKEAEVLECGAMVVKLYKPSAPKRSAFREAANLAFAESCGLPVPSVQGIERIGERWGVFMTRVEGLSFAEAVTRQPDSLPAYMKQMALLQMRVHSHPGTHLPSLKARLVANIRQAGNLAERRRTELLSRLVALPDGDRLCHGDFHAFNILGPPGDETLVDWLDASRGDPAADVCRSYVLMMHSSPRLASAYVDAYVGVSGESRESILNWLPIVAGARLAEGVPSETDGLIEMASHG